MHSALATPDPHWLRCERSFIQHSSVIGSRPEWETLTCSPPKNQGTEHVWAGRGGLSAGAAWAGPPSQLLGAPGPLRSPGLMHRLQPLQLPADSGKQQLY